jgi:hypothetical protein
VDGIDGTLRDDYYVSAECGLAQPLQLDRSACSSICTTTTPFLRNRIEAAPSGT